MAALDQHRRFQERRPNGRFLIRKRPLRVAPRNDRYWPKAAVALKPSRMSELGQHATFAGVPATSEVGGKADEIGTITDMPAAMSAVEGRADIVCQGLSGPLVAISGHCALWWRPQRRDG